MAKRKNRKGKGKGKRRGPTPPRKRQAPVRRVGDSYLEVEGVTVEGVRAFFEAMAGLHRAAPWDVLEAQDLIRAQVPGMGVEEACLAVDGEGLAIYPTVSDHHAFLDRKMFGALEMDDDEEDEEVPARVLAVFAPMGELPKPMQQEIRREELPVASSSAVPWLIYARLDGEIEAFGEDELVLMAAVARAVPRLVERHRDLFLAGHGPMASEGFSAEEVGVELRLSAPYYESMAQTRGSQASTIEMTPELTKLTAQIHELTVQTFAQEPHMALGGWPPIEAVETPRQRRRVAAILADWQAKAPELDLDPVRRQLGLGS